MAPEFAVGNDEGIELAVDIAVFAAVFWKRRSWIFGPGWIA